MFMSDRSLTGYEDMDAVSGQWDEEVYLYDSVGMWWSVCRVLCRLIINLGLGAVLPV